MNKFFQKKILIKIAIIVILVESLLLMSDGQGKSNKSLQAYALDVIETCSKSNYKPGCYDEEIPKLMDDISYEKAFEVTKLVQAQDKNYWYCHVLGHNLSARETSKDPSKWMEVVARAPSGICSNGAIHGAFQERFRVEILSDEQIKDILPDLQRVCEKRENFRPTGLEQASCYHALGHLTMYMTGANIDKSLNTCDKITSAFKQMCYDGIFMQIYQPLEPEDFALVLDVAPKSQKESEDFCNKFSDDDFVKGTCIRESWPLWRTELSQAEGILGFCGKTPNAEEYNKCLNAVFYINVPQLGFNLKRVSDICSNLPKYEKGKCFANSASRMIETDYRLAESSVGLCKEAELEGVGELCYQELAFYAGFNYHPGSPESIALCNSLPEGWQDKCLSGKVNFLEF